MASKLQNNQEKPNKRRKSIPTGSAKATVQFDSTRFKSKAHEQKFYPYIKDKKVVGERKLILNPGEFPAIQQEINRRGWSHICKLVGRGYVEITQEFFANITVHQDPKFQEFKSFVRGKDIEFTPTILNELLHTQDASIYGCQFDEWSKMPAQKEETVRVLCHPGAKWKEGKNSEGKSLKKCDLVPTAKIWCTFVQGTILPLLHANSVCKKRAVMIWAIMNKWDPK